MALAQRVKDVLPPIMSSLTVAGNSGVSTLAQCTAVDLREADGIAFVISVVYPNSAGVGNLTVNCYVSHEDVDASYSTEVFGSATTVTAVQNSTVIKGFSYDGLQDHAFAKIRITNAGSASTADDVVVTLRAIKTRAH